MTVAVALSRTLVAAFWLATAAYAFLVAVPFVYEQFLLPGLVPALVVFARWQGLAALVAAALTGVAVWPDVTARRALVVHAALLWITSLAAVAAFVAQPLVRLEPGPVALLVAVAALVPVAGLAGTDLAVTRWPESPRSSDLVARDGVVALLAAASVTGLSVVAGLVSTRAIDVLGLLQTTAAHAVLFAAFFAAVVAVRAAADLTSKPAPWEALFGSALLAALIGAATVSVILPAVSQRDGASTAVAFAFGATLGGFLAARGIRRGTSVEGDGLALAFSGLVPARALAPTLPVAVAWTCAIVVVALGFRAASAAMDWNFVVAKIGAVTVWLLVTATVMQWAPARVYLPAAVPFAATAAALALYLAAAGRLPVGPVTLEAATTAGDAWVVGDPSFRTLRDWLQRPVPLAEAGVAADPGGLPFFDYLQAHTNIGRSVKVDPVPVHLADLGRSSFGGAPARRPHVFVFVIDSLRRDYLSPYNRAVTFTPALDAFARDSTTFTRAFTRYGATGLSVPSIWTGGMILHKQYVLPFAPMNALHALLEHHQYARWISQDNIVEIVTPRTPALDELDKGRGVAHFRLCSTVDELTTRLDRLTPGGPPTFVWSLPQDVHVAVMNREGNAAVDGGDYDGFSAPYASRVRRVDACFGRFVEALKGRGLYDDSLIVFTSDHGDSLGEEGRRGHAYTVFPEVVQVPLLVHLPAYARAGFEARADALAFTTDITPTLYALLGHTPSPPSPIFGRPLYWKRGTPPPPAIDFGLMASSYGSVYAWVDPEGTRMYIADGVALRDYAYRLDGSAAGVAERVTAAERARGQEAIRGGIAAIAGFYGFTPPAP